MLKCKRCGSTQIVKNGIVRNKQRYLCKRCGFHFVDGDQREDVKSTVFKALCVIFHALGAKKYSLIGKHLNRDSSTIFRWMNDKSLEPKRKWDAHINEYWSLNSLYEEIEYSGFKDGKPFLMADNVITGLYIAVIVQNKKIDK